MRGVWAKNTLLILISNCKQRNLMLCIICIFVPDKVSFACFYFCTCWFPLNLRCCNAVFSSPKHCIQHRTSAIFLSKQTAGLLHTICTTVLHYITLLQLQYTVKKVSDFPVPSRDVTYQTLPGRELLNFVSPWSLHLLFYCSMHNF